LEFLNDIIEKNDKNLILINNKCIIFSSLYTIYRTNAVENFYTLLEFVKAEKDNVPLPK